jgi:thiamine biosynthesis lipoprotein
MKFLLFLFSFCSVLNLLVAQQTYARELELMGSAFDIKVVATNEEKANEYIDAAVGEIERIEKLISSWDEHSQTSEINRYAGSKPVEVPRELFQLIERSMAISKLTNGAFDISYAALDSVWTFDAAMKHIPEESEVAASTLRVGFQHIALDTKKSTVFLTKKGMKIGFGAIGKGYAADKAKELLLSKGAIAGIINASGDMNTWGTQPDGKPWNIAIKNPLDKNKVFATMPLNNRAVVTSGSYEKYVLLNQKKFGHIIDPKTGYPAEGLISVTVFAPKAELADALATAVFVMGKEVGINLINQIPEVACILIDQSGRVTVSENIKRNNI